MDIQRAKVHPARILTLLFTTASLLMLAPAAHATELTGRIVMIELAKDFGNYAFLKLDVSHSAPIGCHINGYWQFTLPLGTDLERRIYTLAATAMMAGQVVRLRGSGGCTDFPHIESAVSLRVEKP
jgi:hypothetical protein